MIGRDPVSDFCLAEPTVAGRHAVVQVEDDQVKVTDLGSRNGTKINGARLAPDVPSTLEPGDFIHLGRVLLSFHLTPPPAGAPSPRPPAKAKAAAKAAEFPWKWVAIGIAFLFVGLLGAFVALVVVKPDGTEVAAQGPAPVAAPPPSPLPAPERNEPAPPPAVQPAKERAEEQPERAAPGALPPQIFVSFKTCPDLIEVERKSYYPARLSDWNASTVEAIGADGKLYSIPAGRVTKIVDRADLSRRAALKRGQLAANDADGRLALAGWCARRFAGREVRQLVTEVLRLRPDDEAAKTLQALVGEPQ